MQLETRHCTLCGPAAEKAVKFPANFNEEDLNAAIFSARRSPDRKHFRLVECNTCGIIYSDPACDPSLLSSLYQQGTVNYGTQEEQIYQSYSVVLDRALKRITKRDTFLEIGGGRGFMLKYGAKHGFKNLIEVEPSADAERKFTAPPSHPSSKFIRNIFIPGVLPKNSVSFACFFQMLDHVPEPIQFLKSVHDAMEPGGVAVCVTHNTQALSAKLLNEKSPIYDIEHTYLFNPSNLSKLFAQAGFTQIESFAVSNRYALRYWLNLTPLPAFIKRGLLSVFEFTGLADVKIKLNAGNFGVIGVKSS